MLLCRVPEAGSGAHQAVRPQDGSDEVTSCTKIACARFDYFTETLL